MKFAYSFLPWINQRIWWLPVRLLLKYFCHFSIEGLENVKVVKSKKIIFAANHSSFFDPAAITVALPYFSRFVPMFYVSRAKKYYHTDSWLLRLFYGGFFFRIFGAYPTFSGHKNYEISLTHHIRLLNSGLPVLIFPEGGIRRSDQTKEPRGGVAFLAERTDATVIPVHVSGLYDLSSEDFFARKRRAKITFGKPIEPDSSEETLVDIDDETRFRESSRELVGEIYALEQVGGMSL